MMMVCSLRYKAKQVKGQVLIIIMLFQQFRHGHCCDGWHGDVSEDVQRVGGDGWFALVQRLDDHLPRVTIGIASNRQQGHDVLLPANPHPKDTHFSHSHMYTPTVDLLKVKQEVKADLMSGYLETSVDTSRKRRVGSVSLNTSAMAEMEPHSQSVSSPCAVTLAL